MPVFEYTATNASGESVRGTLMSASLVTAAEDLTRQGFQVQHVGLAANANDPIPTEFARGGAAPEEAPRDITSERPYVMTGIVGPLVLQVPLSALLFFFRQLSTLLNAGVGMVQSLDTLANQTHDPRLRAIVRELREHALAGRPISAGIQRYPETFSPLMISLVRVGEESGNLDRSLAQIAGYLEREIELRNLLRRVTIYPKLVLAASVIIILATNAIIASIGRGQGIDSLLTRWSTWVVLGPLIVGIWLFIRIGLKNPRIKFQYDQIILSLPLFGPAVHQLCMAKFGRAFGTLYAGGVPVPRAVQHAADACGNEYLRARIYPAARGLEDGQGMTDCFTATGVFSPLVLDMTRTGETTGNVDQMLERMAVFYEDDAQTKATQFGWAFGVLVFLIVAVYVAYTVITFYVGYFGGIQRAGAEAAGTLLF